MMRRPMGGVVIWSWVQGPGSMVFAGWSSPVARQAHNLKVVSSNLAPATKSLKTSTLKNPAFAGFFCFPDSE
jgi:hypothetical protein